MAQNISSDPIVYSHPASGQAEETPPYSSSNPPVDPQTIRGREGTSLSSEYVETVNSRLPPLAPTSHFVPRPNPERSTLHAPAQPPPPPPPLRMPGHVPQEFSVTPSKPPNSQMRYLGRDFQYPANPVMSNRHQSPQHTFPPAGSLEYAQRNFAYAQAAAAAAAAAAVVAGSPHMQWYNSTPYFPPPQNPNFRPQQSTEWPYTGQGYTLRQGHHQPQLGAYQSPHPRSPQSMEQNFENLRLSNSAGAGPQSTSPGAPRAKAITRGPPRRPRQSGPALWIGNLPLKTTVHELKELFSRGRKDEIESVRLLSKTSCAFVNYRTHEACESARKEFHDTPLGAARLSCKIAENMTDKKAMDRDSRGESKSPGHSRESSLDHAHKSDLSRSSSRKSKPGRAKSPPVSSSTKPPPSQAAQDRYFVLKSLTLQDVESSTVTGLWATQAHNEEQLIQAYQSSTNVYLIFSVNKSGEYFGYARMASPIPVTNSALQESASSNIAESTPGSAGGLGPSMQFGHVHNQHATVTLETAHAPKGQIYEEVERGIIFWEATPEPQTISSASDDVAEGNIAAAAVDQVDKGVQDTQGQGEGEGKTPMAAAERLASMNTKKTLSPSDAADANHMSGNFFRIDWIVIRKLPFFKCRGLRNAWNSNKKVKVARDGTELETVVGRKLLELFQRIPA